MIDRELMAFRELYHIRRIGDCFSVVATRDGSTSVSPSSVSFHRECRRISEWYGLRSSTVGQLRHGLIDIGNAAKGVCGGIQALVLTESHGTAKVEKRSGEKKLRAQEVNCSVSAQGGSLVPATISSTNPSQLLLAVSSAPSTGSSTSGSFVGAPYLQAVDLKTAHHVSRQALTRTNATDINIGPEQNKIVEPRVTFLQTTSDGRWLATVDEWSPPWRDLAQLSTEEGEGTWSKLARRRIKREVHLKFWSWNSVSQQWELVTRVDGPHSSFEDGMTGTGNVLDLQADPGEPAFATIGEDYMIRIWQSKSRLRNNMVIRGENGDASVEWRCRRVIQLRNGMSSLLARRLAPSSTESSSIGMEVTLSTTARLTYSGDGSVLAASPPQMLRLDDDDDAAVGLIYFIDPDRGEIRHCHTGLYSGKLTGLGFVERYLVTLGDGLKVWDTVQDQLVYGFSLWKRHGGRVASKIGAEVTAFEHLAVDQVHRTFAIALPLSSSDIGRFQQHTKMNDSSRYHPNGHDEKVEDDMTTRMLSSDTGRSQVFVFDPKQPVPLHVLSLPRLVTALIAIPGSPMSGYVLIDSSAEMRIISGSSSTFPDVARIASDTTQTRSENAAEDDDGSRPIILLEHGPDGQKMIDVNRRGDDQPTEMIVTGEDIIKARPNEDEDEDEDQNEDDDGEEEEAPVVRQEQLAAIFDVGPAYALPPLQQLFHSVAELFSKKPLPRL